MDFKEEALKVKEDLIADIQTLCRIPSVLDPATAKEGQPFGQGCREALDCMLAFGRRDGFEVKDVDGYAEAIKKLVDNPELRASMKEDCIAAVAPFEISNALQVMWDIYEEILGERVGR